MAAIARLFRFLFPVALTGAVMALQTPSAFAIDWRQSGSQRCAVTGCGGSGSSSSSGSRTYAPAEPAQPSPADLKQRQMVALQAQGRAQFSAGKYTEALRLFELSLKMCVAADDIQNLRGNIGEAHANLGVHAYKRGNLEQALRHFELGKEYMADLPQYKNHIADNTANLATARAEVSAKRRAKLAEQQDKAAAKNMQKSIQKFAQTLNTTPASGGLDFDGHTSGNAPNASANGGGLDFAAVVLASSQTAPVPPSGDPRVVDTRVPSGLSKPVENAIAGAYANAPPGVSDRVRKGFQAIADSDWKVAKAWFEEALQRDPGNARLKGLVAALADQSPDRKKQATSAARDSSPARHTLASLNANASNMSTEQVLQALEDITTQHFFEQTFGEVK